MLAPVRIRRGGDFFEITKIKFGNLVESEKIPQKIVENDPIYIDDSQEYTESDGSAVGDLIASGLLTKGVK